MVLKLVTSPTNPRVLHARKIARSPALRRENGETLLEGRKVIEEALARRVPVSCVFISQEFAAQDRGWIRGNLPQDTDVFEVPRTLLKKMSALETPEGILAVCSLKSRALSDLKPKVWGAVLDGIQEPGNAGAIARAALAFGAECLVFTRGTVDPIHPRTVRGSMGALFSLPFATADVADLTEWTRRRGMTLVGSHPRRGSLLEDSDIRPPFLIVLGSEGRGISQELEASIGVRVRVPTEQVESLPVVVAAGILFYELARQHRYPPTE
jgi:TrmH family RNA methyltransferase